MNAPNCIGPTNERRHELDAGDVLFTSQDPAASIFKVETGNLFLFKSLPGKRRQILSLLSRGEFFGFPAQGVRGCSAQCLSAAQVREISLDRLDDRQLQSVTQAVETELSEAYERLTWLGRKTARERVASFLVNFAASKLETPVKTALLADFLGLRIETVSRILHQMCRDGIILQASLADKLMVLDLAALQRLANGN